MFAQTKNLNGLLDRACELITSLEGYAKNNYQGSVTQKDVDAFFNEIDMLNEDHGPDYDSAGFAEEDRIVEGQYRVMFADTDPDLEAQDYNTFGNNKI
jgi:hypothetical protein